MYIWSAIIVSLAGALPALARNSGRGHPNGPVGLPSHVLLRDSRERMRRHRRELVNEHAPEIEAFNRELAAERVKADADLAEMKSVEATNLDAGILDTAQMDYNYDFSFVPEWFTALPGDVYTAKGFVVESLSSLAHMGTWR